MKQKYISSIMQKIRQYVITNYKKVDNDKFVLGEIPYNFRCHFNSVQKVKEGKADKVFACIAIHRADTDLIIIHFINQLSNGSYQDNTWGWIQEEYDYYIIREIDNSEYSSVSGILGSIRENLVIHNSSGFLRKLLRIKLDII